MKNLAILGAVLALSLTGAGAATAQAGHGHGAQPPDAADRSSHSQPGPSGGDQTHMMQKMMQMMMRMHGGMMGGGDMDMMGSDRMSGMAMMDREMMQMMMGAESMGSPSSEDAAAAMHSRLAEFDADGDGSLSLDEFKALHTAMISEIIVDRFQHLDADGDGLVTKAEMGAPVRRMEMHGRMRAMMTGDSADDDDD